MKRSRLSYDEWRCILKKNIAGKQLDGDFFRGYIGLIEIYEVDEPQIWRFHGEDIVVCDEGLKWLSILPRQDFFCITAMMNEKDEILLWYIDMIAGQGVDSDQIPYFDDCYLDLVVYPDGEIVEDDRDELENALQQKDITSQQYELALQTSEKLRNGLLSDVENFKKFTYKCLDLI